MKIEILNNRLYEFFATENIKASFIKREIEKKKSYTFISYFVDTHVHFSKCYQFIKDELKKHNTIFSCYPKKNSTRINLYIPDVIYEKSDLNQYIGFFIVPIIGHMLKTQEVKEIYKDQLPVIFDYMLKIELSLRKQYKNVFELRILDSHKEYVAFLGEMKEYLPNFNYEVVRTP